MGQIINNYTFRLFKKRVTPSFIGGAGSILDFSDSDNLYNYDHSEKEADRNSIQSDWLQVGKDLQNIIDEHPAPINVP